MRAGRHFGGIVGFIVGGFGTAAALIDVVEGLIYITDFLNYVAARSRFGTNKEAWKQKLLNKLQRKFTIVLETKPSHEWKPATEFP